MFFRLIVPLSLLSVVALYLNSRWSADGFFINLATGLIDIIITVVYVDWTLRRNEARRWKSTDERIANRLRILLNATTGSIRNAVGISHDLANVDIRKAFDLLAAHKDVMRIAEHVVLPSLRRQVHALDENGWKTYHRQIAHAHNNVSITIGAFQTRLSPSQLTDLLDLQEALFNSLTFCTTFPDIAGVPPSRLPEMKTSPDVIQHQGCESTAKELEMALNAETLRVNCGCPLTGASEARVTTLLKRSVDEDLQFSPLTANAAAHIPFDPGLHGRRLEIIGGKQRHEPMTRQEAAEFSHAALHRHLSVCRNAPIPTLTSTTPARINTSNAVCTLPPISRAIPRMIKMHAIIESSWCS